MKINILITDDMAEYRKHFSSMISKEPDMNVVGIAKSGAEAFSLAKKLKPDIILMDIQMETDNAGIDATKKILKILPNTKIVILTIHGDSENIFAGYDAGIVDFILKTSTQYEIITAIRDAYDFETTQNNVNNIVKDEMLKLRKERDSFLYCANLISRLSKSEIDILKLLCEGKKYKEIAETRFVEESTIRVMVNKISKKLSGDNIREIIKQMNLNGIAKMLEKF